jgi:hypothetical protein
MAIRKLAPLSLVRAAYVFFGRFNAVPAAPVLGFAARPAPVAASAVEDGLPDNA